MADYDATPDASAAPHPDSILRLASAVHRFSIPYINKEDQLSYQESFQSSAASHRNTMAALQSADNRREEIKQCMEGASLSHADLCQSLQEYISCKIR